MGQNAHSSKFAEHTKVGGVVGAADSCAALQRTLAGPVQSWSRRNVMKLSKGNCTVLHLERCSSLHWYALGTTQVANRFAEKFLGVLPDNKLSLSQQ